MSSLDQNAKNVGGQKSNERINIISAPDQSIEAAAALGFATNLGSWGPLLAGYYEASREELPGELDFWTSYITPQTEVLEIGAGSGFIATALAQKSPHSLILVEPEIENIKLLEANLMRTNSSIVPQLICSKFETTEILPQDLIIFPYDSLPMITDAQERAKLFSIVSKNLKDNGQFILHISTPAWADRYIAASQIIKKNKYQLSTGINVTVDRYVKRISLTEYIKFISIDARELRIKENYVALTSIVTSDEVFSAAENAGLTLIERYEDFHFTKSSSDNTDDDIFIFKKK